MSLDKFKINIEVSQNFDDAWNDAMYHCDNGNHGFSMSQKHKAESLDSGKLLQKIKKLEIENLKCKSKTSKHPCFQFFISYFLNIVEKVSG